MSLKDILLKSIRKSVFLVYCSVLLVTCFLLSWQWLEQESKLCEKLPSKDWASWFIWPSEAADHQRPILCEYSSKFFSWVFPSIIKDDLLVFDLIDPHIGKLQWIYLKWSINWSRRTVYYIVKVCALKNQSFESSSAWIYLSKQLLCIL